MATGSNKEVRVHRVVDTPQQDSTNNNSLSSDDTQMNMEDIVFDDEEYFSGDDFVDEDEEAEVDEGKDEEAVLHGEDVVVVGTMTTSTEGIIKTRKRRIRLHRKRYKPRKKILFAPRVFRADVRRQYINMMVNSANSGDHQLCGGFYRTFGTANPILRGFGVQAPVSVKASGSEESFSVEGVNHLACYLATLHYSMPDFCLTTENVEIRTRGGSMQCIIECDLMLKGTLVVPKWIDDLAEEVSEAFDDLQIDEKTTTSAESSRKNDQVIQKTTNKLQDQKLQNIECTEVKIQGRFRMFVDEHKRIYLVDFQGGN